MNIRERYETLGLANMELRAPIQAIGYAPRQWRYPERGSLIDEIQRTGQTIYHQAKKRKIKVLANEKKRNIMRT